MALLPAPSDELGFLQSSPRRFGAGSSQDKFLSPRSKATLRLKPIAQAPDNLAADDETLTPAPSVTGAAHGPGGTESAGTRQPTDQYGTSMRGDQPDIDFQAEQAINSRYLTRLRENNEEAALLGDPQEKELEAQKKKAAIEDYMPLNAKPSIRATLRPGMEMSEVDYGTPPPSAPRVGEARAARQAAASLQANPSVFNESQKEASKAENEAKASRLIQDYNHTLAALQASNFPDKATRIARLTEVHKQNLANLGVHVPTYTAPLRLPPPE